MAKKRLGELLLERGLIDADQLNSALSYQRQWGYRLGTALVAKGFITEGNLTRVLSESLQIPMVDLSKITTDKRALALLNATTCEEFDIFPISIKEHRGRKTLLLAMADPLNVAAIDEVAFTTDMTVRPAIAQISSLRMAVKKHYHNQQVEIPPLDFSKKPLGAAAAPKTAGPSMTITRGGSEQEIVVDDDAEVIDLTQEVAAAEAAQRFAAYGRAPAAPGKDPFAQLPTSGAFPYGQPMTMDNFVGQPTGAYMIAVPQQPLAPARPPPDAGIPPSTFPEAPIAQEATELEALEKKFWALMRVLARKGLITKDEFLAELKND